MGKKMKNLLTLVILLATTITVQAQQKYTQIDLGKGTDGEAWHTNKEFPRPLQAKRWMTAMFTTPRMNGQHVVIYVEVDCSDNTIRLHGMEVYRNMRKVGEVEEVTGWATPKGPAKRLYDSVCTTRSNRTQIS
jgi:hypothetical protein